MNGEIFFTERNIHGAWVVYGTEGVKQYYGCTKREAEEKYRQSFREIVCQKRKWGNDVERRDTICNRKSRS